MSPPAGDDVVILRVGTPKPPLNIPIAFPDFSNLHLELMEDPKHVRSGAPNLIPVVRQDRQDGARTAGFSDGARPSASKSKGTPPVPLKDKDSLTTSASKVDKDLQLMRKTKKGKTSVIANHFLDAREPTLKSDRLNKKSEDSESMIDDSDSLSNAGSDDSDDTSGIVSESSTSEDGITFLKDPAGASGPAGIAAGAGAAAGGGSKRDVPTAAAAAGGPGQDHGGSIPQLLPQEEPALPFIKVEQKSPEEERVLLLKKVETWRRVYRGKPNVIIPEFNEYTDLATLKKWVAEFERNSNMDNAIYFYRKGLQFGLMSGEELVVTMGATSMKGFAKSQIAIMDETYDPLIVELAEQSTIMTWYGSQGPEIKLLIILLFQAFVYYKFGTSKSSSGAGQNGGAPPPKMKKPSINIEDIH